MQHLISYNDAVPGSQVLTLSVPQASGEIEVLKLVDPKLLAKSQVTIFWKATLGTLTNMAVRVYVTRDKGGTVWFQIPVFDTTTGNLKDTPALLYSGSPTQAGAIQVAQDVPLSACFGLRITVTGTGAGGTSGTLNECSVLFRDN